MTKQKSTPEYVTREILKEEISASENRLGAKLQGLDTKIDNVGTRLDAKIVNVEKRLDAKIDNVEKRLDAKIHNVEKHLDAKIDNVEKRLDSKIETTAQSYEDYTDHRFNQLDAKMTKYFELMMSTIINGMNEIRKVLTNHEQRISVLEGKAP